MAVVMQGFYRDGAANEEKSGEWWNFLNAEIPKLGKQGAGFDTIWLPPFSTATGPGPNGHDLYDYFDLGDYNQKGSIKTAYGNGESFADLWETSMRTSWRRLPVGSSATSLGADEEEVNPLDGELRTKEFQ